MDREPALLIQLVAAACALAVAFGLPLATSQQLAIQQFVGIVVAIMVTSGVITRSRVWCPKSVETVADVAYRKGLADAGPQ